MHESSHAKEFP